MKWVVSRYDRITQVNDAFHVHISKIIEEVRSDRHQDIVARIVAEFAANGKSDKHKRLKEMLPYHTPGGTFDHRSSDGVQEASELLQGDIDGLNDRRLGWAIDDLMKKREVSRILVQVSNREYQRLLLSLP